MLAIWPCALLAQPQEVQYNPNSLNPIPRYEQLYKLRTWRKIDLSEKQNRGFFSRNGELSKFIIDAARAGEITDIYKNDSLKSTYTKQEWFGLLVQQQGQKFQPWDPTFSYFVGDVVEFNGQNYMCNLDNINGIAPDQATGGEWQATTQGKALEYLARDVYIVNLCEDVIFDRRRSRLYYDIQCAELQAWDVNTSTFKSLGWYKYKDLEKLFRDHPEKAYWFNRQNTAENKNFADAFLLRLFHGTLYKVENPEDETIFDTYGAAHGGNYKQAVWATEWNEMQLMEKEHNLWEF